MIWTSRASTERAVIHSFWGEDCFPPRCIIMVVMFCLDTYDKRLMFSKSKGYPNCWCP